MNFDAPDLTILHIPEPDLSFGYGQSTDHPKDGLFLFGPHRPETIRRQITVGVVGTEDGLGYFRDWARRAMAEIAVPAPGKKDKENRLHISNFPGLEAAFGIVIDPSDFIEYVVSADAIDQSTSTENHHEAVSQTVDLFLDAVEIHDQNEERSVDVWVFILPEVIFSRCTRLSRRAGVTLSPGEYVRRQKARTNMPLLDPIVDTSKEDIFDDIPDFHRQVKARLLKRGFTSQLVRETTLAPDAFLNRAGFPLRGVQDPATIAWNLATGLYYKTQSEPPWKIANMRDSVCYVGLVFKNLPNDPNQHACCAAQMFLSEGDGMIFRGANGPWATEEGEFHLKEDAAKDLIGKVLKTYMDKFGSYPKELFIHGRAGFSREEWSAFEEVAPPETNIIGVRIRTTSGQVKLFRDGKYPTLRGTALMIDDRNAFLWTSGYVARLDTYIGPETPNPLHITILRSTGNTPELPTILADVMALTKINYNACDPAPRIPAMILQSPRL
ncbi:MAG: hypothetical protein V7675_17745, partial [Hyphomonas sp.]|uniref:argonaute/piwi family protein n=1 Tax=Hyphomonas sp. TaxID=87 RepID=UPI003002DB62